MALRNPRQVRTHRKHASARDVLVSRVSRASIFGQHRKREIYRLRTQAGAADLFAVFPKIFKNREELEYIHGPAVPKDFSQLFTKQALFAPASALNEVVWAIARCAQYGQELKEFNEKREIFERQLLSEDKASVAKSLEDINNQFGASIWLMQNSLSVAQTWGGIDETRKLVSNYEQEIGGNSLTRLILQFIGKRVEATGLRDYLKEELRKIIDDWPNKEEVVRQYLNAKLFELWDISTDDVPATLFFEAQSSVIDHYETLICVLQAAASDRKIPEKLATLLEKPLNALSKQTGDKRLDGILRGLGLIPLEAISVDPDRAEIIESYTKGEYANCSQLASQRILNYPEDLGILAIAVKASLNNQEKPEVRNGLLGEISRHLIEIYSASTDFYNSAYALITLIERHYGQAWANFLQALVRYELRVESAHYPPAWMRDVYVRDVNISPFSAVAAVGRAKINLENNSHVHDAYPATTFAYKAVVQGNADRGQVEENRFKRYLGRYYLTAQRPTDALNILSTQPKAQLVSDQLRNAGACAVACLMKEDLSGAVRHIVEAYLDNKYAATLLPIQTIVNALGEPSNWPLDIDVPLLFELYSTYIDRDKLTHLRFSFERFQLRENITYPEEFRLKIEIFGKNKVVEYLDRVWRPEIMRQTILYSGTREIEEARVQVCRLLVELDELNSQDYLSEIKERVKQQEIAKATTLVEQSKVYVDIQAIKKSLHKRLGDSYSRYKSTNQTKSDSLLYQISELLSETAEANNISISGMLSSLHVLGREETVTESDVQFDALFSEITSEFLRGDHGLNAYLSTRVRHGTLANTLRKPVADEGLVTSRSEDGKRYLENTNWDLHEFSNNKSQRSEILQLLQDFAAEFDSVIEHVRDQLLQIRISSVLKLENDNNPALFVYKSSPLERRFFQEYDRDLADIDKLITRCVDSLWEKTDKNLANVQRILSTTIRNRLMHAFDRLTDGINSLSNRENIGELTNAIAKARTATNVRLNQVVSWFKRSEVYDRQDYQIDFPAQVAQNMISRTMSSAKDWLGLSIEADSDGMLIPGRTLDGMVDIYYGLLENAIRHSGSSPNELKVNLKINCRDGKYSARLSNNLNSSVDACELKNRLEEISSGIKKANSARKAQIEGSSGLHKVWLALNAPTYRDPSLDFNVTDSREFVVVLGYSFERVSHEVLIN